ncbi:MAG TPA: HAMP domain-containing sensor histidine kinase [Chloroflexota bacterium]
MRWNWLKSMRVRILASYVGVLSAVLLGYCLFQTITLADYFRSASALSMQQTADAELASVGPCYVQSPADLKRSATPLAWLLGSQNGTATIVTSSGTILANHSAGVAGLPRPSAALIRQLIPIGKSIATDGTKQPWSSTCQPASAATPHFAAQHTSPAIRSGDVLRTAIVLGPTTHPVGYAILGRSVATESAALLRLRSTLWAGALVVLFITAVVALPIMNRALRPLTRVTAAAEAIASGDLDRRANLSPSMDEVGRLGNAFDIMVDRLHEALSSATASEERMRQFLADASHELRTPLTVLCGTTEILRQHNLDRLETDTAHQAINQEATRMARLVDDLLRLSRLDAGQVLDPRPLTVSAFLEEFVARYAPAWPQRSLEVDRSNLNGTQVHVDPEALTKVLTNLVENAARYSAPGGPIRIQGTAVEQLVTITVADEGPGLSSDDAERVFERFYRGSKSRSRQSGGSGLGLSIVQALVRQSQGEVRLDTGPDRGTSVTITLPKQGLA